MNKCFLCNTETKNKKFCSKSCSVSYNNTVRPKRKKSIKRCKHCFIKLDASRKTCCESCNPNNKNWNDITYGEVCEGRKYQKNSRIRELARRLYFKHNDKLCKKCGYDKHIEICHIKSISSHTIDTPISEINSLNNLIGLCRNCHWEFDAGILKI